MVSKDKTVVTFHSGILTIGGTVIEVAYKDAHIFFDFGTEYHPEEKLPDELLQTLVDHRMVPHLKNVYDPRLAYRYVGDETKTYTHTAVFMSHAHLDHSRMINYLDPAIPLYTLKETKLILNELNRHGEFLLPSPFEDKAFTRDMIGLDENSLVEVGEIKVEVVPVEHDAYGASALLIKTPDAFITYTGDLRLHGHDNQKTLDFCEKAKGTDLLMMEGVTISFPERKPEPGQVKIESEQDLISKFIAYQEENPNRQITFNGYPANVQRFNQIVRQSPRTVVLEANQAALVQEIFGTKSHYYYAQDDRRLAQLDPSLEVSYDDLLADKSKYLWQVVDNFENLQDGSLYLHSDAQPLGDYDPAYRPFLDLLASKNITFVRLACTGHAKPADLRRIIDMIQPKTLVPIHTLKPELLENPYGERILPVRGEKIVL